MNILFLSKIKPFSEQAADMIRQKEPFAEIIFGERGDPFPESILGKKFDYVFSYICPWIVPKEMLEKTQVAAINFHPGPPEYPGIGCTNFAIYYNEVEYGVTAHHMTEKVDSGDIITVRRFPVSGDETLYSLTQKCYAQIFESFKEIWEDIVQGRPLPKSTETWKRKPYTREELERLCQIGDDMPDKEIKRRIRATDYPGMPGAYKIADGTQLTLDENGNIQKR